MQPTDQKFRETPPPESEMTAFELPAVRRRQLPGGIELYVYDRCDSPVVYITHVAPCGEAELPGPAYGALLSIMRQEGTTSFDGPRINSITDYNGAWIRSYATDHRMVVSMKLLADTLDDVLPVFKELTFNPVFPPEPLAVRREALARNIEVSLTDVDFLANCAADRLIKGADHPSARIDMPDAIRAITAERLHSEFAAITSPRLGTLFLCGMITPETEEKVAAAFSDIDAPHGGGPRAGQIATHPYKPAPAGTLEHITKPDATQSCVVMTLPTIGRAHPDYIPLHITVSALGGYFGSRLMSNIRERLGLTYGISAALMGCADGAYVQIQADTDHTYVDRLIEEVRHELRRMATDPPAGDELMRLRQSLLSGQAGILDSPFSIIDYHITALTAAIPDGYFGRKLKAIAAMTPDAIADIARRYLDPDELRIVVAGK